MTLAIQHLDSARITTLPNGMTIALEPLPYLRSVSAGVWIKSGSANEAAEQSGIAHFLEHLFFKGTPSRDTHALMDAIEGRGGQFNAFTSHEYTCVFIQVLDDQIDTGLEVLADVILNSLFNDFEKERNVILEEIASIEDTPDDYAHDLLALHHWPDHPLGRAVCGTQETVRALQPSDVRAYYGAWYQPQNMIVSVAGCFDPEAVLARIEAAFAHLPANPLPQRCGAPRFNPGVKKVERPISQTHLGIAFPGATVDAEARYTLEVLSHVLGAGSTSRLFERIREDEGLAYNIYSYQSSYFTAGMFGIYAALHPGNLDKAIGLTMAELRNMREKAPPEDELRSSKEQIKGRLLMALESTSTRMGRMAKSLMYYGRLVPIDEIIERIERVGPEDVRALAEALFQPGHCALLAYGADGGKSKNWIAL